MLKRLNVMDNIVDNSTIVDCLEHLGLATERWQITGLQGTEKQIAWANSIALDRIKETNAILNNYAKKGAAKEKLNLVLNKLIEKLGNNDAKYWIETRNIEIDKFLLAK